LPVDFRLAGKIADESSITPDTAYPGIARGREPQVNIGIGLLAGGTAVVLALSACGSDGNGGGVVAHPPWENGLGPGVTVLAPGSFPAGNGSPGAAVTGMVTGLESSDLTTMCAYFQPMAASSCRQVLGMATSAAMASLMPSLAGEIPHIVNFSVGYTAIDGSEALTVVLGTTCAPNGTGASAPAASPSCTTSSDPAAGLDSGKSFAVLWSAANSSTASSSLAPLVELNGKWYVDSGGTFL
jgi:hypothetical protein